MQVHPKAAGPLLKNIVLTLSRISALDNIVIPKKLDAKAITHEKNTYKIIAKDPHYQYKTTFSTASSLVEISDYIYKNLDKWPKSVKYSLHLSTGDLIVDHKAGMMLFEKAGKGYNQCNEVRIYTGAYHSLKNEIEEWRSQFVKLVSEFIL